ncbi:MAG: hypothetical protein C4516_10620 [Oxalobacter sp.]|nr:MAG: hypothetical protein C4516_10620 [Oxalobacter sp.]
MDLWFIVHETAFTTLIMLVKATIVAITHDPTFQNSAAFCEMKEAKSKTPQFAKFFSEYVSFLCLLGTTYAPGLLAKCARETRITCHRCK